MSGIGWTPRTPVRARLPLSSVRQCRCPWVWIQCLLRSAAWTSAPASTPLWGIVPEECWSSERLDMLYWVTLTHERTTLEKCATAYSRWAAWICSDRAKWRARKPWRAARRYPHMSARNPTCLWTRWQSCPRPASWTSSYLWDRTLRILPIQTYTEIPRVCGARTAADPSQRELDPVDIICCVNIVIVGKPLLDPGRNATVSGTASVSRVVKVACGRRWRKLKVTKVQFLKGRTLFPLSRLNLRVGWIARIAVSGTFCYDLFWLAFKWHQVRRATHTLCCHSLSLIFLSAQTKCSVSSVTMIYLLSFTVSHNESYIFRFGPFIFKRLVWICCHIKSITWI